MMIMLISDRDPIMDHAIDAFVGYGATINDDGKCIVSMIDEGNICLYEGILKM